VKKSVQISISPKKSGLGMLTIEDAMEQVWDFFDLLSDENNQHVKWILEHAQFNSPLVITAKPIDIQTNKLANEAIDPTVRDIVSAITNLSSSQPHPVNLSDRKLEKITQLLERNTNGIERTECDFGNGIEPVVIDQSFAEAGLKLLTRTSDLDNLLTTFSVRGYGSIDGSLIQLGTHYKKPAIQVKEFNTGNNIWCQVDRHTIARLNNKLRVKDFWEHREVRVQGMLNYDDIGKLTHIIDGRVSYLNRRQVPLDELHDPDFSEGHPSEEYLRRLRED